MTEIDSLALGEKSFSEELARLRALHGRGTFSSPFYQRRGITAGAFRSYADFSSLPFMTKADLRGSRVYDRSSATPEEVYGIFSSTGTSGRKTFYVYSDADVEVHRGCVRRFYSELGIGPRDLGGVLVPVDAGVMAHTMMWQYSIMGAAYVNCPEPSPDAVCELLESLPVTVLSSRPEVLCMKGADKGQVDAFRRSSVRMLLPGGSFLSEARRSYLEDVWDAECFNMFGMSEVFGPLAGECRARDGQHYPSDLLMVEVIDPESGRLVAPGEMGVAVYTTLWPKGMPLVRYWTGDYVRLVEGPCACGSAHPRFEYLGREDDVFEREGRLLFPKELEELLVPAGFVGGYEVATRDDGTFSVRVEAAAPEFVPAKTRRAVEGLLEGACCFESVPIGSLGLEKRHFHDERGLS